MSELVNEFDDEVGGTIVGVVQFAPAHKDLKKNIANVCDLIAHCTADLLVFPELSLSGYAFSSPEEARPFAIEADGEEIQNIAACARSNKVAIVLGFAQAEGDDLFNSSVAISSTGDIAGLYQKQHLFYYEKMVFYQGELGRPVFDVMIRDDRSVKVGMEICYDWRFPENTLEMAFQGAEIVAIPSNIVTTTGMLHETLRVRAFDNKVIIAFADRIGSEMLETEAGQEKLKFRGESCIINYNGEILSKLSTTENSIAYATVRTEKTHSKRINDHNDLFEDRKQLDAGVVQNEEEDEE
ncbi:MAG TPA: nitrilase-related carbon-nitrogen hydrolase [Candidatus Kapabacteria bacterium]|nr:nitrilase-related carbon-nitrogen hydrolase [Candidatus Kapabacteria bacterium]